MEHPIGSSAQHNFEWQIILTENETVIVRPRIQVAAPANPSAPIIESTSAQSVASSVRPASLSHPRIYANMR